jgi:hypothetical protein
MNIEKLFELAETANDIELYWLFQQLSSAIDGRDSERVSDMITFHRLYGEKLVAIFRAWSRYDLLLQLEMELVEEPMRARLEA